MNDQGSRIRDLDRDLAAMTALARRVTEQMNAVADTGPEAGTGAPPREHGPRVEVAQGGGMVRAGAPRAQQEHLDDLVRRYTARTAASKRLTQRHRRRLADSRAVVGFRRSTKEMLYPVAAARAAGARIEDIDGNVYTDITMGFGVLLFGHEPEFVREAVNAHLSRGIRLGPRSAETGETAELLAELTGLERVAFANSGTEANAAAIRLARAATGRDRIVTFQGAYHGHADQVLGRVAGRDGSARTVPVSRGIPDSAVAELSVLTYGSEEALAAIERDAGRIAAVVVEPVQSRNPALQPVEFVRRLRALTARHGIVLLFDEMLTGFRPAPRGAQELYGVTPDLATYGKLLGGGFPIGAIAGRADIMDGVDGGWWSYGDDSVPPADTTFFGGTYLQHPVSMTAARAVLTHLREQGPELQRRLNARTAELATGLNAFFEEEEFPLRVRWFGSQFRFEHHADMELLYYHLMLRGVHVWEWRNFFLSTAHTDEDVARVDEAVRGALRELRAGGFFPTDRPRTHVPATTPAAATAPAPATRPAPAPTPTPAPAPAPAPAARPAGSPGRRADFGLYFFGDYPQDETENAAEGRGRYEVLMEAARFADRHDFSSLWMPERHFHSFGGLFPNPAVLAAALSRETERVRLNAGSVVLPLHDPIRVAEEWSMADNLSGGRIGLGVASGWNADDFVFFPERFGRHKQEMYERLEQVRTLWRGDALRRATGDGEREIRLFPRPVQEMPPCYTAVVANPESYELAARHDLGIVTNLMTQDVAQLRENIARYRAARAEHGLDPEAGRVAVLLHTYIGEDHETARAEAFEPMARYMRASLALFSGVTNSLGLHADLRSLSEDDLDVVFRRAYGRYCDQRALIGDVESVLPVAEAVADAGADEIVALVDFGVADALLRAGLPRLDALRRRHRERPAPEADAPLSPGQERIWFLERLLPGRTAYNEVKAIRLSGPLDTGALHVALRRLVERHEMLRTVFRPAGESAVQRVRAVPAPDFEVVDGTARPEAAVREALAAESSRRFDLERGPLFVSRLVRTAADEHVLVLSFHHIVVDAASATVLSRDLSAFYRAERDGTPAGLPALGRRYADHARRARAAQDGPEAARDLAYWLRALGGGLPVLELPTDRPRPERMTSEGRAVFHSLGPELTGRVRALGASRRATLFMTLLAGWAAMLRRVTGQEDVVVGVPVSERPRGAEELVGFFVNTLAVRVDLTGDPGFETLLDRVRGVALDAYDHAGTPFERVVRELAPPRGTDRTPVFQVCAEFQSAEPFRFDLPDVEAVPLDAGPDKALTDLTVYFTDGPEGVRCHLEYNADLFDAETVDGFFAVFRDVLAAATAEPRAPLSRLAPPAAEGDPVPEEWERGPVRPVEETTVHAWVARRAAERPDHPAVVAGETVLSYGELEARAERLAGALRALAPGDGSGGVVAVWLPRSVDLVVAQLAVWKTGGAYLPLDPSLGTARATDVVAESRAYAVVSAGAGVPPLRPPGPVAVVAPDAAAPEGGTRPASAPGDGASPACVLYTSGSTGVPKGVVLTHRGLVDLCGWHHARFGFTGEDRSAAVCGQSFDALLLEVWPALTAGGTVVVADEAVRTDPPALARWYAERRVAFSILPTALGEQLMRLPAGDQPPLRHLLLGGEQLRVRPRAEARYEAVNVYGPTETTVLCVAETVAPPTDGADTGPIPIGRPVDNVRLRVVDDAGRPVPVGAVGELLVSGPGVADGYLHRPDLTGERFREEPAPRHYRTGDLVRWTPAGRLSFVGRADDQVKIRGFRVEPEEVARVLGRLAGVRRAAVVGRVRDNGETVLDAHVVPVAPVEGGADGHRALAGRLARELADRLPEYMVPRAWNVLAALPLSANGKLDRGQLPPAGLRLGVGGPPAPERVPGPPSPARGGRLREIWGAEFDLAPEAVDPEVSLFDLGGHSLTAMRLVNRFREEWGVEYPLSRLYEEPTLRAVETFLDGGADGGADPGGADPGGGAAAAPGRRVVRAGPATEQQARFATRHAEHARPQVYNVALRIDLSGTLDEEALASALRTVAERHESLRTRLVREADGGWRQEVLEPVPVALPVDDLTDRPEAEREALVGEIARRAAETPLDPYTGDVLAHRLVRAGADAWTLVLVLHHCTCDGWAVTVLLKEVAALYRAALTGADDGLSPEPPQQLEYARWQAELFRTTGERRLAYWLEELADAPFRAGLPLDRPRPETLSGAGGVVPFTVPADVWKAVERWAARRGTTPFVVTAAALGRLLGGKAERPDVLLNISYAGRESRAFESLVGCTATGFTLRVRDGDGGSFAALVDRVAGSVVRGMEQAMPARRVAPAMRERTGVPMPDALALGLAYESSLDTGMDLPGLTATVEDVAPDASRAEFIMVLDPAGGELGGVVEYSADLWDRETVRTWTEEYVALLRESVEEPAGEVTG
ncbi:amino acid adenylation domain-containing protein/natural product biosynthesis luciferase-like monooxygenase domain-containing protein [Streptomyces zhaozhouensis]|uniref:Amino acid adenylation domain-containing protein/natural product biosynthesis luciferase-like monooxygenase domain-containing protein n=1 Tax=Streptomyces zhaozhouensis TaxID=1300267 RepID=A0A286DU96_9ACTN|nr:MupA/Atu3671 family FMN-dependent luciferase-like monooxygenase [Streptomyces zhaozhouensis]SOD62232.1 amino acid adenylation domain-containing protein/natural product biosynthesis luciferase-like monooxygenase domain-containing protein [Streptomyces zhaozhouensis]